MDKAILEALRRDARQPSAAIAAEVGLSPSACHRRIRLLEQSGAIQGYTVLTKRSDQDGGEISIIVQITLERQTEDYLVRFEAAVRRCPEVRECFLMTGEVDYWLRLEVETAAAYERIHGKVLSRLPGVMRIQSSFAMRDALRPHRPKRFAHVGGG